MKGPKAQQVPSDGTDKTEPQMPISTTETNPEEPRQYLLSDSDAEDVVVGVNEVRVYDKGSYHSLYE